MFVIQYILLKVWTGAAMDGIGILRNIIFIFTVKKGKPTLIWIILFSILTVILGADFGTTSLKACLFDENGKLIVRNPHSTT